MCIGCWSRAHRRFGGRPLFSKDGYRYWLRYSIGMLTGARNRDLKVAVDHDDLTDLWLKQQGVCALSGVRVAISGMAAGTRNDPTAASVDRIDNSKGYYPDNVQIVCMRINFMKAALQQDEFLDWCRCVATYDQRKREDELLEFVS